MTERTYKRTSQDVSILGQGNDFFIRPSRPEMCLCYGASGCFDPLYLSVQQSLGFFVGLLVRGRWVSYFWARRTDTG